MTEQHLGLRLRKEMLQKLKHQVMLYLGKESSSLRRYALPYKKDIERTRWKFAEPKDFFKTLLDSDIILGGDFHPFAQAQRSHLRLLRELAKTKKIILALECIPSTKQKVVDHFISGKINEDEFLKKVKWQKIWGFPWKQYKPFFDLLRNTGGRCIAVNRLESSRSLRSLRIRDQHATKILVDAVKNKEKDEIIYVIFGDLHIAREHLPKLIKKKLSKVRLTSIYLNPEHLYFQIYKKNRDHIHNVVQLASREFCLIESPPWVKWQSYLIFLSEYYDQALDEEESIDYSSHVMDLIHVLVSDFSFSMEDHLTVYSFNDDDFVDLLQERLPPAFFTTVRERMSHDMSCYIPQLKIGFLARGTVNYAAHLAGLIVHAHVSGLKQLLLPQKSCFEVFIWQEAVAFFLSKMINPNRKSMRLDDLKKQLQAFSPKDQGEEALRFALDQKMQDLLIVYGDGKEERRERRVTASQASMALRAAKILGAMFGEKIFLSYKTGHLSKEQIREYIKHPLDDKNFYDFYIQVLKTVDKIELEAAYG